MTFISKVHVCLLTISLAFCFGQDNSLTDTVFVTATRIKTNISSLPISTALVSQSEINNKSIGDIASALSGIAGLDIRNYSLINGASSISLFGSTSQQVLVLLDGLPINSQSTGMPDLGLFPVTDLDRIEIVKGPTSSLYGANALGGVVNLITQDPYDFLFKPGYKTKFEYGTYKTYKFDLEIKDTINKYRYIINGHENTSHGLRTNEDAATQGLQFVSAYNFTIDRRIRLDLRYENKEIGSPGPKPDTSQFFLYGDSTASSRYDRQWDTLYLLKSSGDFNIQSNWNLSYHSQYLINNTRYLWIDQYSLDTSLFEDHYRSKSFNINLINHYEFAQQASFTLGADFENNNFNAFSQYPSDTSWNPSINKYGIFAEVSYAYQNIIQSFTSVRYDQNSGFGKFISPAIGFNWTILPYLKLRTHLGQAYRAPTMNDLYWPISGNPQIKPENGTTYQLGVDFIPNPNISLSITGFSRKTKNLINWLPDSANIWRPTNVDSSMVTGLEGNGRIKIVNNLYFGCNATLQNALQIRKEIVYDDWLTPITRFEYIKRKQAFLPGLMLSSNINYQVKPKTTLTLYAIYTGSRLNYYTSYASLPDITILTKKLPAHFTISTHISHQILNQVNLTLKIENILNAQYTEQFGNSIIDKDYPRPGRVIFLGVEIKN